MATFIPDQSFYPSPKMAMEAPREQLAYVAVIDGDFNGNGGRRPDALAVVDVDPAFVDLRPDRRPAGYAERRRRAAPLRLERLQLRALPDYAAPARRAPLPDRARACARRASTSSTPSPTRASRGSSR